MPITPYRALSWEPNDVVSADKMNRMTSNDQYLFDHMPKALYRAYGTRRDTDIKIAGGLCLIRAGKRPEGTNNVNFGSFFSPRCDPIITTGVNNSEQHRIFVAIHGLGQARPDNRGFRVRVTVNAAHKKHQRIKRRFYVSWIALGY